MVVTGGKQIVQVGEEAEVPENDSVKESLMDSLEYHRLKHKTKSYWEGVLYSV